MKREINIIFDSVQLKVELFDTPTADNIFKCLPFESEVRTWGDEVYFSTPVYVDLEEDARDIVEPGELAFWVEGNCIAIGFGKTPISQGDEIRLAAKTNIWGVTADDVRELTLVKNGESVRLEIKKGGSVNY